MNALGLNRRTFLKQGGLAVAGLAAGSHLLAAGSGDAPSVAVVVDPDDAVAAAPSVRWAVDELQEALRGRGATVTVVSLPEQIPEELPGPWWWPAPPAPLRGIFSGVTAMPCRRRRPRP